MREFSRDFRPPFGERLTLINVRTGDIITWTGQLWYPGILEWPDVQRNEWPPNIGGDYCWVPLKSIGDEGN